MESTLQQAATIEQAIDLGLRSDEFEMICEMTCVKDVCTRLTD